MANETWDRLAVTVRHGNERTAEACLALARQIFPGVEVEAISGRPFARVLRMTYEYGLASGKPWLVVIDGDVLLHPERTRRLLALVDLLPPEIFEFQGKMIDRLSGGIRAAGFHVYRVEHIERALAFLPDEFSVLRPEQHVMNSMAAAGFPFLQLDDVLGLHDYEQYYRDIYRKAFFFTRKWRGAIPFWSRYWDRLRCTEPDFAVAYAAYERARVTEGPVFSDTEGVPAEWIGETLRQLGIGEKDEFSKDLETALDVTRLVERFRPCPEYFSWLGAMQAEAAAEQVRSATASTTDRIREVLSRNGPVRGAVVVCGHALRRTGGWLVGRFSRR